jgi:hypothetical protein
MFDGFLNKYFTMPRRRSRQQSQSIRKSRQCMSNTLQQKQCRKRTAHTKKCWIHLAKEDNLRIKNPQILQVLVKRFI